MRYIALCFSLFLVGLDQLFKQLAIDYLAQRPDLTLPIIEDFFHLTYLQNRGAAFGILSGKAIFLIVITLIIVIIGIVLILLNKVKSNFLLWSVATVIGGGVGNLIDRMFRGYVIDYFDFRVINFAVFNFADCCVVVGTILIIVYILFLDNNNKQVLVSSEIYKNTHDSEIDISEETMSEIDNNYSSDDVKINESSVNDE